MKMSIRKWIVVSGLTWLAVGSLLMVKGLKWITQAITTSEGASLIQGLASLAGTTHQGGLFLICIALFIGFIKGRMILSKTVQRVVLRLRSQEAPIPLSHAYDRRYVLLLSSMMLLGLLFRFLPIGLDIRGAMDVAIGSALMHGAMLYFREAVVPSKAT